MAGTVALPAQWTPAEWEEAARCQGWADAATVQRLAFWGWLVQVKHRGQHPDWW